MSEGNAAAAEAQSRVLHTNSGQFSTLTPIDPCTSTSVQEDLRAQVTAALGRGERGLMVNLANTPSANSAMLETLLDITEQAQGANGWLRLAQPHR